MNKLSVPGLLFLLPLLPFAAGRAGAEERPAQPPNLVLILIDDLGYGDIGPFGSKLNKTPNLDRMAKEGMKLTSFYACPVCTPSRAQFMTGCYAKRVSLPNVLFPAAAIGLSADEVTLPALLKKRGYATVCIGKWHLGDQPEFLPTRRGFDHYFGLPYSNDMGGPGDPKGEGRQKYPPLPLLRDDKVIETVSPEGQSKLTARYTDEAVKFIKEHKDKPFFLYLPHTAVHNPHHPGADFRGKSGHGAYNDWVEEVDASVGRVLDTLRELKLEGRTLVLFTSDNGGTKAASNAPLRGYKASTLEGGMREPTIAWWPGKIAAGSTCDAVTANLDVLPTFVKLAGGELPKGRTIDGKDIWPLLAGKSKESPHEAFYYFRGNKLEAVRSGPWKLQLEGTKLYNLDKDIGESKDVAADHPDVVKKLQGYVEKVRDDLGIDKPGPGCRPPGKVADPKPLLLKKDKDAPDDAFTSGVDVGKVALPGTTKVLADKGGYRITGSGDNIWNKADAFHFAARKVSGDLVLGMDVEWVGEGKAKHRKACAMVRQDLEADSPYADVAVHGDGLIALQYRRTKGGLTFSVPTPIKAPATVKLERDGNVFTVSVARKGQPFQPVGAVSVELTDPVYAGLAVCSHDATVSETAIFSNVTFKNRVAARGETRVHEASLEIVSVETGERRVVYRAREPFQAPNWSKDGKTLYINQRNRMYTLPVEGGKPKLLDTGAAVGCNNDHGLSPDGKWLAVSSGHEKEGSKIYIVPANGGAARLVTPKGPSYWHGWSPDGKTLVYCAKRGDNFDVYAIPAEGGEEKRLTDAEGLDDGPEYTPDGKLIYFNSERTGLMKIWRMNADGSRQEQVTTDSEYADWFPHPSPDGKWLVFLSFDKSVKGHPTNKDVVLRVMPLSGGKPRVLATLFGGQGTINVPSWSPDSKSVAFVSYRLVLP